MANEENTKPGRFADAPGLPSDSTILNGIESVKDKEKRERVAAKYIMMGGVIYRKMIVQNEFETGYVVKDESYGFTDIVPREMLLDEASTRNP